MRILRTFAFLLLVAQFLAQQARANRSQSEADAGRRIRSYGAGSLLPGYTKKVRNVPAEMKREVYREYGATLHGPGDYEVDHLIPLELGGSNSFKNLWPESHRTSPWNAQVKDRLEGKLHELVCIGQLDLKKAQQAIAANWIEAYETYVGPNTPISRLALPSVSASPLNGDQVWVNTKSGKYWKPGSKYYGKTKAGRIHVRRRSRPEGVSASERFRRMTTAVNHKLSSSWNSVRHT